MVHDSLYVASVTSGDNFFHVVQLAVAVFAGPVFSASMLLLLTGVLCVLPPELESSVERLPELEFSIERLPESSPSVLESSPLVLGSSIVVLESLDEVLESSVEVLVSSIKGFLGFLLEISALISGALLGFPWASASVIVVAWPLVPRLESINIIVPTPRMSATRPLPEGEMLVAVVGGCR